LFASGKVGTIAVAWKWMMGPGASKNSAGDIIAALLKGLWRKKLRWKAFIVGRSVAVLRTANIYYLVR